MATILTPEEIAGLRLFIGAANCVQCHNGPLLTDHQFHNTGPPLSEEAPPDDGRATGLPRVLTDEFNCLSRYSDAAGEDCTNLHTVETQRKGPVYAFKTPTLRNVADTAPYMHAGQFATLGEVLDHYNEARPAPLGRTELLQLGLSQPELAQLEAFMRSLSAPLAVSPELLVAPD
jgi:cytochrome c peroxidase